MRIDEEHGEDFAVAGLGDVGERKGLYLVLEDVWEGEEAGLPREHAAEIEDSRVILRDVEVGFEGVVFALFHWG